ncbi:hypothetical protein JG620_08740, partial [Devosia sp. MC521]|nr:hypothetical protein [Devosia sp. MC521]
TGKRRQWAPPIAKRRAKSAQTRKSDDHNRSRRLSEPVLAGLQLSRFGIVEFDDSEAGDRRYRVKPFAKAYISKAIPFDESVAKSVMAKFRQVSAAYQYESAGRLRDRYNPRNFVVTSPSQAIAARKLRHAVTLVHSGDIDAAEEY